MNLLTLAQRWAWKSIAFIALQCMAIHSSKAQQNLPVIHATSRIVDIRDGGKMQKSVWNLSPDIKPDVYYSLESEGTRRVSFYTDIDSISFDVEHNQNYDFLVVLNQVDTCYTRIEGGKPKERVVRTLLSPDQTQKDMMLLVESLQREHGDVTRYKSKEELKELSKALFGKLDHAMDQYEFYLFVSKLISEIQDGHTGSSLPSELIADYEGGVKMFPVQLWFDGEHSFVACDRFPSLPVGTEILSINGENVNGIKKKLFEYLSSDGSIVSKKHWILNYGGFPLLYSWVYGRVDSYTLDYKDEKGEVKQLSIDADYLNNSQCMAYSQEFDEYLDLEFLPNSTAILTIRSFHNKKLLQTEEDFKKFLFYSFKKIKDQGINKLIIDLRYNTGGENANGAQLYSYLTDRPFQFSSDPVSGPVWDYPSANNYQGKVIFLINGLSFSTTSNFAAIARSSARGVFVGEETGGAYYGGSSGEVFSLTLPNSKIRVSIPKNPSTNPVKEIPVKDRGVIPDFIITPSLKNVIDQEDVQLKFAIDLVNRTESEKGNR